MHDTCHKLSHSPPLLKPPPSLSPLALTSNNTSSENLTSEMASMTRDRTAVILLSLLFLVAVTGSEAGKDKGGENGLFLLGNFRSVIKTEEGEVKVVSGHRWRGDPNPMHIGFISMEPNTLFVPQYVDANLIIFVRTGHAKIGWICKDRMAKRRLRAGDVSVIPAGSAFYLINDCKDQRLQMVACIDSAESLGFSSYQSFFLGGGSDPTSILSGFDFETMTAAFNITSEQLGIMMRQSAGPIIRINPDERRTETSFYNESEKENAGSMWGRVVDYVLGRHPRQSRGRKHDSLQAPEAYNLYDRKADFTNDYGSSIAVGENKYAPLKNTGIGVYFVNLTAGSMMAPHVNPSATEFGIILGGLGSIQVVFPNGTTAMNAEVSEGDVFWIPRYFPFCQVASRGGPLQFFGFTTSSRKNRPQFLVGRKSVLRTMNGAALALAFNVSEDQLDLVLRAQREEVILPTMDPVTGQSKRGKLEEESEVQEEEVMMSRRFMFA